MILKEAAQQFIDWTKKKIKHHFDKDPRELYFREKEIWWAALGKNIGYEADGKHELFERPVLVLKKYSKDMCFILPLTTQIKNPLPWYQIAVTLEDKISAVNITQGRSISRKRLLRKAGVVHPEVFTAIVKKFISQF
jgi:mRNA interferase MazF